MASKKIPIQIVDTKEHGHFEVPFSPPSEGIIDFSKMFITQTSVKNNNENTFDLNSNYLPTTANNAKVVSIQTDNINMKSIINSFLPKSEKVSPNGSENSSPFQIRKHNSEFVNKMMDTAFNKNQDSNKTIKEYRELNKIIPDSL